MTLVAVNLIDSTVVSSRRRRRRLKSWSVVLIVALVVGTFPIGVELSRHKKVQSLAYTLRSTALQIDATRAELNKTGLETRTLRSQVERAEALRSKRSWSRVLGLLSNRLPEEMWLVSVSTDPAAPRRGDIDLTPHEKDEKAPKTRQVVQIDAPQALKFDGYTLRHASLYEFMSAMKGTGAFQEVNLTKAFEEPVLKGRAVRFEIVCRW